MSALRLVLVLAAVPICYLLFFHSQPDPAAAPDSPAHSQYKQAMDKANAAAKAMQDERAEADQP